jgi:PqqD family protein of HPr-rel-A system
VADAGPGRHGGPARPPEVTAFPLDDHLVLYDARDGVVHVLNPTAAQVWADCDGARDAAALARALAARCGIPERRARADVRSLLAELRCTGLLVAR